MDRAIADSADLGWVKVITFHPSQSVEEKGCQRIKVVAALGATIVGAHAGRVPMRATKNCQMCSFSQRSTLAIKHGLGLNKILGTIHFMSWAIKSNV